MSKPPKLRIGDRIIFQYDGQERGGVVHEPIMHPDLNHRDDFVYIKPDDAMGQGHGRYRNTGLHCLTDNSYWLNNPPAITVKDDLFEDI